MTKAQRALTVGVEQDWEYWYQYLAINSGPVTASGCREFVGCLSDTGYGVINMYDITVKAPRLAWSIFYGVPVRGDRYIRHRCDNPICIEPKHLTDGTQADNIRDILERKGHPRATAKITEEQAIEIRSDPRKQFEIAEDYGITRTAVWSIKNGRTWSHLNSPLFKRSRRKLSNSDVQHIISSKETNVKLGERFGVSDGMISMIRSGKYQYKGG